MNDLMSFMDSGAAGDEYVYARGSVAGLRFDCHATERLSVILRRQVLQARDAWAAYEAGQVLLVQRLSVILRRQVLQARDAWAAYEAGQSLLMQRRGPDGVLDHVAILSGGLVAQRDPKREAWAWP